MAFTFKLTVKKLKIFLGQNTIKFNLKNIINFNKLRYFQLQRPIFDFHAKNTYFGYRLPYMK